MTRHIFKIIWNERKINAWLLFEYIIIFCILWFCCDYLYNMTTSYYGPSGFDINHTYLIEMRKKPSLDDEPEKIDKYALAMTMLERVKRYPGIEHVALSHSAIPYANSTWHNGYRINSDSSFQTVRLRFVTSSFFDVFKMNIRQGNIFDWTDNNHSNMVIISPIRGNLFGGNNLEDTPIPISEVKELHYDPEWDGNKRHHTVMGITDMIRDTYFSPYMSNAIHPLEREKVDLSDNEITVRVKPEADKDFIERFTKDMREQLFIGPYYLSSVISIKDKRTRQAEGWGVTTQINNTYAISLFVIVNIFLGILGSFWFRTQSRRSEIGLRIALGASKQRVKLLIIAETLFLLVIASIVSTIICLSIGNDETLRNMGIPTIYKSQWGIGHAQNIINYAITFTFLAIVSIGAVWYPAKQAADTQPAEALHDE